MPLTLKNFYKQGWAPSRRVDQATQGWHYDLGNGTMGGYITNDGLNYYSCNEVSQTVTRYILGTPFDLSSYTSTQTIGGFGAPHQCYVTPDGTKLFVGSWSSNNIRVFNLTTPFDLSSYTEGTAFSSSRATACYFSDNGLHFYTSEDNQNIKHYTLSTAFNLATASLTETYTGAIPSVGCRGLCISSDGLHLFTGTSDNSNIMYVYQYDLSTPYTLGNATVSYTYSTAGLVVGLCAIGNITNDGKYLIFTNGRRYPTRLDMPGN